MVAATLLCLALSLFPLGFGDDRPLPSASVDPFDEPVSPGFPKKPELPSRTEAESTLKNALGVRKLEEGRFAVGDVTGDPADRTVTIPAVAEYPDSGEIVEYALVHESGKTHETLFSTAVSPEQIHLACLLLGVKPVGGPGIIEPTPKLQRQGAVSIEVHWQKGEETIQRALSEFVTIIPLDGEPATEKPMKEKPWLYNGSMFGRSGFAAEIEGSIISIFRDLTALANNISKDAGNDEIHFPNVDLLPPGKTEVSVVFRFPTITEKAPAP